MARAGARRTAAQPPPARSRAHAWQRQLASGCVAGLLALLTCTSAVAEYAERGVYRASSERVVFMGSMTSDSVAEIIAALEKWQAKELVIDSLGGSVPAGLTLGEWIARHDLTVTVNSVCASSCANYVFLAARRKRVLDGGIVAWHGSAEQKNWRENDERHVELLQRRENGKTLTPNLTQLVERYAKRFAESSENRRRQRAFFASIGVKEYITRAGQEPKWSYVGAGWTFTAEDMRLFCVTGLQLPADYGTDDYVARANAKLTKPDYGPTRLHIDNDIRGEIARAEPTVCAAR